MNLLLWRNQVRTKEWRTGQGNQGIACWCLNRKLKGTKKYWGKRINYINSCGLVTWKIWLKAKKMRNYWIMQIPVLSDPKADNLLDYKNNKQNRIGRKYGNLVGHTHSLFSGANPGELKWVNFHPPFSEPLLSFFHIPRILK